MRFIQGRGIWIGREGAEALHEPMELLPECDKLFLSLCPIEKRAEWLLPEVGEAVYPQKIMAQEKEGKKRCYPPTYGRVEAIVKKNLPQGAYWCAQIHPAAPDGEEPKHQLNRPSRQQHSPEVILHLAEELGILDELDGRPLAEKLRQWQKEEIRLLACDAVCDDPYNTDALCALREYPGEVLRGLDLAATACGNAQTVVVTFHKELLGMHEVRRLNSALGGQRQMNVGGSYPIWPKLKKQKPFSEGFGRIGVQACIRLSRALYVQRPPERCVIAVGGEGVVTCRNFSVTVGTPISEVLRYCKTLPEISGTVRIGNTITGTNVRDLSTPVLQDTRCILVGVPDFEYRGTSCIGCGKCNEVCCQKIFVSDAVARLSHGERLLSEDGIQRCIRCYACSFVCPAGIPIAEKIAEQQDRRSETVKKEDEAV